MPEYMGAQQRIYPELRFAERTTGERVLGIGSVLVGLSPLVWIVTHLKDPDLDLVKWFSLLLLLGPIFIGAGAWSVGVKPAEWLAAITYRRAWLHSQQTTQAEFVECFIEPHEDGYGGVSYYTYWVVVRFDCSSGKFDLRTVLKARVSESQYWHLENANTVTVRCAARNPRIALLEGE